MEVFFYHFANTIATIGLLCASIIPAALLALILVVTLKIAQSKRL